MNVTERGKVGFHQVIDPVRADHRAEENPTLAHIYDTLKQPISSIKPKPVLINP